MQKLVTSDGKLIYYENPKRRKYWVDPGQSTSTQKRNVFGKKILIYIWWDEWEVLYYELLKPGETVIGKYYSLQLNHLAEKKTKNKTLYGTWASTSDITAQQCQATQKFCCLRNYKRTAMGSCTASGELPGRCAV